MIMNDCEEVVIELRKIIRSLDIHSRWLNREYALTGPQLVFLKEICEREGIGIGELARRSSLSCATATGIVDRLEQRGFVLRSRSGKDRRQVQLSPTSLGREMYARRPPILQEAFLQALAGQAPGEKQQMLESLQRLSGMMTGIVEENVPAPLVSAEAGVTESREAPLAGKASPAGFLETCRMLLAGSLKEDSDGSGEAPEIREGFVIHVVDNMESLRQRLSVEALAHFLHEHLKPYEDAVADIERGIAHALPEEAGQGGFVLLAEREGELAGALVMLKTGMQGYVPPNLLLFIAVHGAHRQQGIGLALVRKAQSLVKGDIKLHVEYENPARRLYERLGFSSKYAEMRWSHEPSDG